MTYRVHNGDCRDIMAGMDANSVDAIITDPPYFRVVDHEWDRQWPNEAAFIGWLGDVADQWQRILRQNGSLYCFCYPDMAAKIEVMLGKRFNILNHIVWVKPTGMWQKQEKESQRAYFPASERILFAEHYGSDSIAKGESGYAAKCDELRAFVFEPLRSYLFSEVTRAGHTAGTINNAWREDGKGSGGMAGHWLGRSQWQLPTESHYLWLRSVLNATGDEFLRKDYEELRKDYEELRKDYEELRKDYEELRRPFSLTKQNHCTDIWHYNQPLAGPDRHPCEKPVVMLGHMIQNSTRAGATILDCFMGRGSCGVAAVKLGRKFIGIEMDESHFRFAEARIANAAAQGRLAI